MKIVVRADSSALLGIGHLMRCLTLADVLKENGCEVIFVCRDLPGNMNHLATINGHALRVLSGSEYNSAGIGLDWQQDAVATVAAIKQDGLKADCLVIDQYALDHKWQEQLRPYVRKILVIDDLANRVHDCDLLLDQNLYPLMEKRYGGLVPANCRCFLGPRYALLRKEFRELSRQARERDGVIRRILVFFGGSDPTNETMKALSAIKIWNRPDIAVDVVVGGANPRKEEVRQFCATLANADFYYQVDNMAQLMDSADLAIGAAGTSTWERCCLGVPALLVVLAPNQEAVALGVAAAGAGWYLGRSEYLEAGDIVAALEKAQACPESIRQAGKRALEVMGDPGLDGMSEMINAIVGGK